MTRVNLSFIGFQKMAHSSSRIEEITDISKEQFAKYLKFRCPVCDKICASKNALEIHTNIHTGAKPYACTFPDCDAKFNHPGNFRRHMKTVHSVYEV